MNKKTVQREYKPTGAIEYPVEAWPKQHNQSDFVAQEVAVALSYNGISHAVMMASPLQLEEFAVGFSLTEGIISHANDIYAIETIEQKNGIEVALTISSLRFNQLKTRRRNLTGRSGCGICGAETLEQVHHHLNPIISQLNLFHSVINRATLSLTEHQPLQALTGAVHCAAWCNIEGHIIDICEDVGRHNALDKLIGLLWSKNIFQQPGFLLISSRASYEIIQKAAMAGIAVVAALSAPTTLAIDTATRTGVTLIGFSRQNRHVAYSHGWRLVTEDTTTQEQPCPQQS